MQIVKKLVKSVVYAAAIAGFLWGGLEAYKGVKWVRTSHAQAQILWSFLAEPVAKTPDGKNVLRGDVIDTLIRERLNGPTPQAATPASKPSK